MMLRGPLSLLCLLTVTSTVGGPGPGAPTPPLDAPGPARSPTDPPVRPLPFFYDLYTLRGDAGGTTVVAAFAVPVERLERQRVDDEVLYRFDVTLVLSDTVLGSVSRTDDSVFVGVPHPLPGEHLLHTHIEVQAPPSRSTLQRVVMTDASTPGIGQLYGSGFPIPDYSGTDLMLSDIVLGDPRAETGWRRGDVTLALLPTSQLPGSSFDVYYEVYNLPPGNRYSTEITIERAADARREGDGDPVRTRFTGESEAGPDGSLHELRRVDASLDRGRYLLTVTVTDVDTGRTTRKSRPFNVRGFGRGATMVPALPRGGKARPIA